MNDEKIDKLLDMLQQFVDIQQRESDKQINDLIGYSPKWDVNLFALTTAAGQTNATLIGANVQRWMLVVWCNVVNIRLAPSGNQPAGFLGITLPITYPWAQIDYRNFGALVGQSWLYTNAIGPAQISGVEIAWKPQQ